MAKKYFHKNEKGGYSLLELVVYIGLFAVLSIVLTKSLITIMKTYSNVATYGSLQNNGEIVMERLTRQVRAGNVINTAVCPSVSSSLSIVSSQNNEEHTSLFELSDGKIKFSSDGGLTSDLSSDEVSVKTLSFCSFTTPVSSGIKTKMILTSNTAHPISADFYSTILIRGQ